MFTILRLGHLLSTNPFEMPKCLSCNESFKGRIDKKYCSAHCRTTWHNIQHADRNNMIRNINNILRRNRRILNHLLQQGSSNLPPEVLNECGFNFNYFTYQTTLTNGLINTYCYDLGYHQMPNGHLEIVKRKNYLPSR